MKNKSQSQQLKLGRRGQRKGTCRQERSKAAEVSSWILEERDRGKEPVVKKEAILNHIVAGREQHPSPAENLITLAQED